MLHTVADMLSVLGGLTVLFGLVVGIPRAWEEIKRRWANRRAKKDFFYRWVDLGYRIIDPDAEYLAVRHAQIVSRKKGLSSIRVGVRPTGDVRIEEEIQPADCELEEAQPDIEWRHRRVRFAQPLGRRKSFQFSHLKRVFVTGDRPIPYWSWVSEHRVDKVTLRVVFCKVLPEKVTFRVRDTERVELQPPEEIKIDPVDRQAKKVIRYPRPGLEYVLTWVDERVELK